MKCPVCVERGEKSTLHVSGGLTTLLAPYSYYDEDGEHHYHDRNTSSSEWSCSNGHGGSLVTQPSCSAKGCSETGYSRMTVNPDYKPAEYKIITLGGSDEYDIQIHP